MRRSWPILVALIPAGIALAGFQSKPKMTFGDRIAPIVKARCLPCHNPQNPSGGLDLSTAKSARKGGSSGQIAVAGQINSSLIWQRVSGDSMGPRMPMGFRPLRPEELEAIKDWIKAGASFSEQVSTHWAFSAPKLPRVPSVDGKAWSGNPIDAFVHQKLRASGLKMGPTADRATLLRRASLTLTGLPPTLSELESYLADSSPKAYEKAIERLLASSAYGERQAQWWLDLARYADTNGYEKDGKRSAWLYRDWVISAFNRNLSFDQFSVAQLAGDLLPEPNPIQNIVATGFHRNTMLNLEGGVDPDEAMYETINDRVATTSVVWLGLTMACARCHDHKYDPLTQEDYFGLYAYFSNNDYVPRGPAHVSEMKYWEPELSVPTESQRSKLKDIEAKINEAKRQIDGGNEAAKKDYDLALKEQSALKEQIPIALVLKDKARTGPLKAWLRIRGEYGSKDREIEARLPKLLTPKGLNGPKSRLELAKWLFSNGNPLTARVTVNRAWQQHFGTGLVETPDNFGTQGSKPTHPELLDYLAVWFQSKKWSLKDLHRLIVSSETFKQSSNATAKALKFDPKNRLMSRGPRYRLDAEAVRDSALVASGLLKHKIGGPSVFPLQPDGVWNSPYSGESWTTSQGDDLYRRSLYTFWKRTSHYPSFQAFDAPSRETCTVSRSRSNTPMQALVLLNDPVYVEVARCLGERMRAAGSTNKERIEFGFRSVVSRKPTKLELDSVQKLLDKLNNRKTAQPWTQVASVLLNLDEAISVN